MNYIAYALRTLIISEPVSEIKLKKHEEKMCLDQYIVITVSEKNDLLGRKLSN